MGAVVAVVGIVVGMVVWDGLLPPADYLLGRGLGIGGVVASGGVKYPVPSKAVGIVVAVAEQGVGLDGWTGSALGVAVGLGAVFGLEDVDWGAVEGIGLAVGRIRAPLGQGLGLQAWVRV